MYTTKAQICIRRDTAANFTSANPTLALGEIAYETDTRNIKVGDGATAWTALPYINPFRGGTAAANTSNTVLGSGAGAALGASVSANTAIGNGALAQSSSSIHNTAVGYEALQVTNGSFNAAVGSAALRETTGTNNVAVGYAACTGSGGYNSVTAVGSNAAQNNTASQNTAIGAGASLTNTTGQRNTAVGFLALNLNTASDITAVGANALDANTTGTENTAVGKDALGAVTTGVRNTAIGNSAGAALVASSFNVAIGPSALSASDSASGGCIAIGLTALRDSSGAFNVGVGHLAGRGVTSGGNNVAIGTQALLGGGGASNNIAIGRDALIVSTANDLVAVGHAALDANTTGTNNVAVGKDALGANTTAAGSTAVGFEALSTTSTGAESTAVGYRALRLSTVGAQVAVGAEALSSLTSGARNVGIGHAVLNSAASTADDTAVGYWAFINKTTGGQNVAVGAEAGRFITAGTNCTAATSTILIGQDARPSGNSESNQIVIGYQGRGNGSNTTTIGNSSTTGTFIPAGNLTLTNGNFIVGTSGKGIDFSATANSSGTMTSELLSDYEEGTWTPVYTPATGSFTTLTMDVIGAKYVKVGSQVTVTAAIRTDNVDATGASGALRIEGLPFTTASVGRGAGALSGATAWAGDFPMSVLWLESKTYLDLYYRDASDTADLSLVVADMTTGATANQNNIYITCTYMT